MRARGHLFCSALHVGLRYKVLSEAKEKGSDSDDVEGCAPKDGGKINKAIFNVKRVPLRST